MCTVYGFYNKISENSKEICFLSIKSKFFWSSKNFLIFWIPSTKFLINWFLNWFLVKFFWSNLTKKRRPPKIFYTFMKFSLFLMRISKNYNPGQNIWHKVKKSIKIGQDFKNLLSKFAYFLTAIVKVQFLEGRLGTRLRIHPNLTFF